MISTNVPASTRRPGNFHEFDVVSAASGLVPLENSVVLVGDQSSAATAVANEVNEIFDAAQAELLYGKGSVLSLMCRRALAQAIKGGAAPRLFGVGVADAGGAAGTWTLTVTGTATEAGDVVFRVNGRTYRAGVSSGDANTVVATAIKNAIDPDLSDLPVTAGVSLGVCTLTAVNTGLNVDPVVTVVSTPAGTTVVAAAGVAASGSITLTTALANTLAAFYGSVVIASHQSADVTSLIAHLDAAWAASAKRWRFGVLADNATLSSANTLSAVGAEDYRVVVASYEACPMTSAEIAAAVGVALEQQSQPNANWDFRGLDVPLPPDASVYIDSEIESALAAGTTPIVPDDNRTETQIRRLITTKVTENSVPFERTKDVGIVRGMVFTARQLDAMAGARYSQALASANTLKRFRSDTFRVLRALEDLTILQNVETLFAQLITEFDATVPTRINASVPEDVVPALHQRVFKHVLFGS